MTELHAYDSVVNAVHRCHVGDARPVVKKVFRQAATGTGIHLPLSRRDIEARMLIRAADLAQPFRSLATPSLIEANGSDNSITLGLLPGTPLAEQELSGWPDPRVFGELGAFAAAIESVGAAETADLLRTHDAASETITDGLFRLKLITPPRCVALRLSHGDFSLRNVLGDSTTLGVLDFEFAGLRGAGHDVGQFCGNLDAYASRLDAPRDRVAAVREATISGYLDAGGIDTHLAHWRSEYSSYYSGSQAHRAVHTKKGVHA